MKRLVVVAMAVVLSGCAGHAVRFETPDSIATWHDPVRSNQAAVQAIAQTHCAKFGKNAVPVSSTGGAWEGITTTFECRKPA